MENCANFLLLIAIKEKQNIPFNKTKSLSFKINNTVAHMAEEPIQQRRLSKIAKEFNIGVQTIVDFLAKKGQKIDSNPNTKIEENQFKLLVAEFQTEKNIKESSRSVTIGAKKETISIDETSVFEKETINEKEDNDLLIKSNVVEKKEKEVIKLKVEPLAQPKVLGKMDVDALSSRPKTKKEVVKPTPEKKEEPIVESEKVVSAKGEKNVKKEEKPVAESEVKVKVVGKVDLDSMNLKTKPAKKTAKEKKDQKTAAEADRVSKRKSIKKATKEKVNEAPITESIEIPVIEEKIKEDIIVEETTIIAEDVVEPKDEIYKPAIKKLEGPTILGKMDLPVKEDKKKQPVASSNAAFEANAKKKKRKRIKKDFQEGVKPVDSATPPVKTEKFTLTKNFNKKFVKKPGEKAAKVDPTEEEIQKQIKETLARLSGAGKSKTSKYRRLKREAVSQRIQDDADQTEQDKNVLKVTEFVTANELANMMHMPVTNIISTCMALGLFISINQRLDAETLTIVAEEFGYKVEFVSVEVQEAIRVDVEDPDNLVTRPPIVTVMGHVDHGKTSLLDYIRKTNVIAGEAGGITQHIGAYEVMLENGKAITFLDTPGHEAFTAMRARGAQITDVVILVVAADDNVMPQTIEAINHAHAANVPIVIAINKIDKPGANPEKIKEGLANLNVLVEDWGGKYQCQEISAKKGINVEALLDKVLLEAEMLVLKANPKKLALGAIIESSLDKGRGYLSTVLVENGSLHVGDCVLAGCYYGRIKAMFDERNQPINSVGPAMPCLLLGLNGAPQAGDKFNVITDEREAKNIANKRLQLQREQGIRTHKHITLDEIGRRIAIGDFKELNLIIKGDVDGSLEALSDSLMRLSTSKIQVNIIHASVGQVTESDILLASASNAIIIAFQVRPSQSARRLAEQEQIDIRTYSIIYDAIDEVKGAMEGMLSPEIVEKIVCNVEVREVFKITKVGTIAGCMVADGKITRHTKVRLIRDGIVVYTGLLASLKRYKDDVKEVLIGQDCGLNINNFNDIKIGDVIEGYEETEVKAKL